jgi:hypothetical protein
MKKYLPSPLITVTTLAILGLSVFGAKAWYFPTRETWFLVVPVSLVGVALAIQLSSRISHLYSTMALKIGARVCTLLFVPLILGAAFGIGVPALALRILGPDTQITATVTDKIERFKRCTRKIQLAGYWRRLCVTSREFQQLEEGERVWLSARVGVFGTFVFSLQPASQ